MIFSTETCLKFQGNPQPRGDEKKYQSSIISFPSNTPKVNIAGHTSLRTDFQTPNVRDPAIPNASSLQTWFLQNGFRWSAEFGLPASPKCLWVRAIVSFWKVLQKALQLKK